MDCRGWLRKTKLKAFNLWFHIIKKVLIENTQNLIQGQQELYRYIKYMKEKALRINCDVSIDDLTEKFNKLSVSTERFQENTSSHQIFQSNHQCENNHLTNKQS